MHSTPRHQPCGSGAQPVNAFRPSDVTTGCSPAPPVVSPNSPYTVHVVIGERYAGLGARRAKAVRVPEQEAPAGVSADTVGAISIDGIRPDGRLRGEWRSCARAPGRRTGRSSTPSTVARARSPAFVRRAVRPPVAAHVGFG